VIPFGSQRAGGQDLATHLLNTQDNERMELAQVRGAVARDLHGAFAEWEAQAGALTRCTNYLYSLSVNPDQRQGRLTKEQYLDYIERTEQRLGLSGQPRAIVFHVKKDKNGVPREHCHVVWSRIDVERGKARHVAFDHEKLMSVTREFARDHGLKLPEGYDRDKGQERTRKGRQVTSYENRQEQNGGLSREQHQARVTAAWNRRDTPRAFVRSLEDMGYILSTGRRDYVLVDLHGNMNSLPKLIDDRAVRTKHVREFLAKDFPTDSLPSVEEARALASAHRAAMELFSKNEGRAAREAKETERREELQRRQQPRRAGLAQEAKGLAERQRQVRHELSERQRDSRAALRQGYLQETRHIKIERAAHRPKGLAAFLGRVTGIELITKKIHQYRDAKRHEALRAQKKELTEHQHREGVALVRGQELQTLTMQRRLRALELVEQRERQSLETTFLKERRIEEREQSGRAQASIEPARTHADVFNEAAKKPIDLTADFMRAAGSGDSAGEASGGTAQDPAPEVEIKIQRRRRTRQRARDNEPSAEPAGPDGKGEDPSPDRPEPRRRRKRDFDRGL
jgi:hypothetical protein